VQPLLTSDSSRIDLRDPLAGVHETADLLDAWRRTLQSWAVLHGARSPQSEQSAKIELERAILLFARLIDADTESPSVGNASADLMRTELGADAALGLACALHAVGRVDAAASWMQAIERLAPTSNAAKRLPLWRLAFAMDVADVKTMRSILENIPARTLSPGLAIASAQVASRSTSADANAVVAAALESMDANTREMWIGQLASRQGPLQSLASAIKQAHVELPAWQRRDGDVTKSKQIAAELRQAVDRSGGVAPTAMQADAQRSLGWALAMGGDDSAASAAFEKAASLQPALQPECLWLAAMLEPATEQLGKQRRIRLLLRQREVDSQGPYAGRVCAWLSRMDGFESDAVAIAVLLDVPLTDPFAADARAEAARRIFRVGMNDSQSITLAAQRVLRATQPVAFSPIVARWRLIAATTPGSEDIVVAEQALQGLSTKQQDDVAVVTAFCRLCALQADMPRLRQTLAQAPESLRAKAALAVAFTLAGKQSPERVAMAVECAVIAADEKSENPAFYAAVYDRLLRAVLQAADADVMLTADLATRAARLLQASGLQSNEVLFAIAEALRMSGHADESVDHMQALSGTLSQGGESWLQARWRLLRALQSIDTARADAMLRQHMALFPEGGVEPWGARFRAAATMPQVSP